PFCLAGAHEVKISRWIAGVAIALAGLEAGQAADDKPYLVADGNKVDKATLEGRRARARSASLRASPCRPCCRLRPGRACRRPPGPLRGRQARLRHRRSIG